MYIKQLRHVLLAIFACVIFCSCSSSESTKLNESRDSSNVVDDQKSQVDIRLQEMGIQLPEPSTPVANYVNAVRSGKLVFMAGKGPRDENGNLITGKIGVDLTIEEGYDAARLVAIGQLAALKAEVGNLDKVKRIVKVMGMVNTTSDFTQHPEVINGFSDFMVEVFGDHGKHARAAVGMGSLPRNIAVEIEMIVEIED